MIKLDIKGDLHTKYKRNNNNGRNGSNSEENGAYIKDLSNGGINYPTKKTSAKKRRNFGEMKGDAIKCLKR